jgi:hypothetical protein
MCRPLQSPRFVDDALEQPDDGLRIQRPDVLLAHVLQHFPLALGLIDLEAERLFDPADLERAASPIVQKPHEALVELVDPPPQGLDLSTSGRVAAQA